MLYSILKKIPFKGKIEIVDSNNKVHTFGSGSPYSRIRFANKSIERKIFFNPSLYIGEGYMDGEVIIEKGTIEDLLNIITACYDDFVVNNFFFRIYENISSFLKPLHQINKIFQSKK